VVRRYSKHLKVVFSELSEEGGCDGQAVFRPLEGEYSARTQIIESAVVSTSSEPRRKEISGYSDKEAVMVNAISELWVESAQHIFGSAVVSELS
jgi:hypothetical protein